MCQLTCCLNEDKGFYPPGGDCPTYQARPTDLWPPRGYLYPILERWEVKRLVCVDFVKPSQTHSAKYQESISGVASGTENVRAKERGRGERKYRVNTIDNGRWTRSRKYQDSIVDVESNKTNDR